MKTYFLIILAILSVKLIINLTKYIRCRRYLTLYFDWLRDKKDVGWKVTERKSQVIRLFKDAAIEDVSVPHTQPIGYGHIQAGNVSVQMNFPNNRQDIADYTISMFHQAIGTFKARMLETVNPIYWIETIVMLPKATLTYMGIKPEHVSVRILQLIYWMAAATVTAVYSFFKPQLVDFIRELFRK